MSESHNSLKKLQPVDVLVMGLVCLLLVVIMPFACRIVHLNTSRTICAGNLSTIGRAMQAYADDHDGHYPRAGGSESYWSGLIRDWRGYDRIDAYGLSPDGRYGEGAISSCFYLLVKYTGVQPKSFVCPGDSGATEFRPEDEGASNEKIADLWDFGSDPRRHCSYAYHIPFSLYPLDKTSEPEMPLSADRNPWIYAIDSDAKNFKAFDPHGNREAVKAGNSSAHEDEGQNVLCVDGHVSFEERSFCGIDEDNIYTFWVGGDTRRGAFPVAFGCEPQDRRDSLLIHDVAVPLRYTPRTTR